MAIRRPVPRLEQPGSEQPDLDDLTSYPIDLNPVPYSDPIPTHQNKPTAESQDEVLEHDRQSRRSQSQNRRHLRRTAEDHQQHQQQSHQLPSQLNNLSHLLSF